MAPFLLPPLSLLAFGLLPVAPALAAGSGTWGNAEEVPASGSLNVGHNARVYAISCPSAGNCSAGGWYSDDSDNDQAFVVDESNGTWGNAEDVPGTAALNPGGSAEIDSISCASAGNCSAGGLLSSPNSGSTQPFLVDETDGTWADAEDVPGIAGLDGQISGISCAAPGDCSAVGTFNDQAFVTEESDGSWSNTEVVPGTASLNVGGYALAASISCPSVGDCTLGGFYKNASNQLQLFVDNESGSTWDDAVEVPGSAGLNAGGSAQIISVSCSSIGNCSAGGFYYDSSHHSQAFVVAETNLTWGDAEEVPATAGLNGGGFAEVNSVSCTRGGAGDCSLGGVYEASSNHPQAFVDDETSGNWGDAEEVPGTAALNVDSAAVVESVSCPSDGTCTAGGSYTDGSGHTQAFVADEISGIWGDAIEVPGSADLNAGGNAQLYAVSCASDGNCGAGGYYQDGSFAIQAFVANETEAPPTSTCSPTIGYQSCTVGASAAVSGGTLAIEAPSALSWSADLAGAAQEVDVSGAPVTLEPVDATGSGAGWNVTATATTFTDSTDPSAGCGSPCMIAAPPSGDSLALNGDSTAAGPVGPGVECDPSSACTVPAGNDVTYPVGIPGATSPSPVVIYDAQAQSGLGAVQLASDWWLAVPAATLAGTYTNTITVSINSGPSS